ncbi:hypothetical protein ZIOFF_071392 [Zingiber officinale]|uniref:Phosphoadenosine phosphosulphate reductase domain-containing protein n=1 Tax=Zingiber officinale TaxID=94328 RepID=A0A8J5EBE7_ZINOF|nr:hypothetical protein ZIOFF_071392 [Zingiber officinale]
MNPCCFFFLLLPWSLIELPLLHGQTDFHPDLLIFGTNSFYTFTLNLTIFLLVMKTTALTMNVASVIKDGLLIAFSRSIIRDTITPINLFLYDITFLGVSYYNKGPRGLFSHHIHPPLWMHRLWRLQRQLPSVPGAAKRDDLNVQAVAVVEASDTAVGEEDTVDYEKLGKELGIASPLEIIDRALEMFNNEIAITFRAEDVALIEYAKLTGRPFRAFSLDTGRLNPETYRFFDTVEKHYGINIEHMFPDAGEVHTLVRSKGLFSFSEDGHQECC